MTLEKLIKRCKKKDIKAQEELYRLYSGKMFGLCLKYSDSYQQAEDNLQDGFMTIFDKIGQYNNLGSFEGWMKRIVINTALQKHRKEKLYSIANENQIEEATVEYEESSLPLDFLLKIVQQLPQRYREVFNLYVLDGYSHKEIANMLNISEGTSKSNLSRARHILKDNIEKSQINSSAKTL
ncbi:MULTISPECIES: RNA polymerase sigma factor [unclassified Zunongwangia]|uniref:RNA polymerase sigma factor n=1 Tax=unclassified Zunongwangia TaxID=2632541 RepID=UPI0022DE6FA6|nr:MULTISPECIES: RNA polymerase sigma factor [unclassified Zunongwangia]WBL22428.1 RNA polymerase sigma factor [Zunongwangia sp. HRR-M8]WBL25622.1 RNA polymerase sigma factor [Zunongwangia sp. HGR-M22]